MDKNVVKQSEMKIRHIAIPTNNDSDTIDGTLVEITSEELRQADKYEVKDYKRISVSFQSGRIA